MGNSRYQLAIETSYRPGSISLACGDQLLVSEDLPDPSRPSRGQGNRLDLMASIDQLTRQHCVTPSQIDEVYLSIGPGSFTGLRTAVATAKTLAYTLGIRLVAVPTVEAIALNVSADTLTLQKPPCEYLAVCLNLKRDTVYVGLFENDPNRSRWQLTQPPAVWTLDQLLNTAPRPLAIVGDPLPQQLLDASLDGVAILDSALAIPRNETVWQIGHAMAQQGRYTDPFKLSPLYVRPPEAEELWNKRHNSPTPASQPESMPMEQALP